MRFKLRACVFIYIFYRIFYLLLLLFLYSIINYLYIPFNKIFSFFPLFLFALFYHQLLFLTSSSFFVYFIYLFIYLFVYLMFLNLYLLFHTSYYFFLHLLPLFLLLPPNTYQSPLFHSNLVVLTLTYANNSLSSTVLVKSIIN